MTTAYDGYKEETFGVATSRVRADYIEHRASGAAGFYGATPIVQPTNAAQAALTLTTGTSGGFGFSTTTAFTAFIAQLENIRASLVLLGLLKGS